MMLLRDTSIFIVEDNLKNRIVYQIALISQGAHLTFDEWGHDVTYQMRNMYKCDLIILDLMLVEGKSGFEVFKEIRSLPRFQSVPIVAVSAIDPSVAIPRARSLGFTGFIAKPIDKNLFPQQVLEVINGAEHWRRT